MGLASTLSEVAGGQTPRTLMAFQCFQQWKEKNKKNIIIFIGSSLHTVFNRPSVWGNWKGIRQKMSKAKKSADLVTELYDLKNDPGENDNIANKHPEIVRKIESIMVEARTPSKLFPLLPEERQLARKAK